MSNEIEIDDNLELKDDDFIPKNDDNVMEVDNDENTTITTATTETDDLRANAVFVEGVDDLSTKDVQKYVLEYIKENFRIEWINDTSGMLS